MFYLINTNITSVNVNEHDLLVVLNIICNII